MLLSFLLNLRFTLVSIIFGIETVMLSVEI